MLAVDPGSLSPFGPAKWWAVSTLALTAVAGALWRERRPGEVGLFARTGKPLVVAWGAFAGLLALAASTGPDRLYAWIGTPERNFGVLTWLLARELHQVAGSVGLQRGTLTASSAALLTAAASGATCRPFRWCSPWSCSPGRCCPGSTTAVPAHTPSGRRPRSPAPLVAQLPELAGRRALRDPDSPEDDAE